MSDAVRDDLPVENTPKGSPLPSHDEEPQSELVGSYFPQVTENYTPEATVNHEVEAPAPIYELQEELEEPLHEPETSATPIPPALIMSPAAPTRTVAIIKPHGLPHRFDIEHRISEAGFEIVKERQMEFDVETDPETLYELFGDEFECFAEGPVWVYVLERRRAVEVWATLMGHPDPAIARRETPTALRALYGSSLQQNAVMGSPDSPTAEMQIAAIFASSPPFPTTELPDVGSLTSGSLRSVSSSVLSALRKMGSSDSGSGNTPFKARKLPATHTAPDIVPRMSRAAALRAGLPVEKTSGPRAPISKERLAQTFENVPGHKRSSTITVASTAPPVVAPRMTRAAALRLGLPPPEKEHRRNSIQVLSSTTKVRSPDEAKATFDGVPGHKRRETITVASVKAPTVAPRSNRSASLRQQKEAAPPTSYMFRASSNQAPSRSSSRTSFSGTGSARSVIQRPPSAASVQPAPSRPMAPRVTSTSSVRSTTSQRSTSRPSTSAGAPSTPSATTNGGHKATDANGAERPKPRPRPSSVQAPTIAPRTNKSALLRAQKMAAAAAAATPAGKKSVSSTPRTVKV